LRLWNVAVIAGLFFCFTSLPVHADGVFLEGGQGLFQSQYSQGGFLSYQKDSRPLFGIDGYYNMSLGAWNESNRNRVVILSKGFLWGFGDKRYLCFEPGGAYVAETTHNLGTHAQFSLKFALGMKKDRFDYSICYRHLSNGAGIFGWTTRNNFGENFITLQIGYLL
jgi:hypothetical protein